VAPSPQAFAGGPDGAEPAFRWLLTLRWAAILGQILTIAGVELWLQLGLPLPELSLVIGLEAATNLVAEALGRRGHGGSRAALALMLVDLLCLTALFWLTGGPMNPFNFLYLVHIALAAVLLPPAWTWGLAALATVLFGSLFLDHWPLGRAGGGPASPGGHAGHVGHGAMGHGGAPGDPSMALHLQGMWVAFAVAAAFITTFVTRVKSALRRRDEALAAARAQVERTERLGSLATLAAGAAHELGTPLSTIAVAARELERELTGLAEGAAEGAGPAADLAALGDDARLIRQEVARCREVLDRLAADAGQSAGEAPQATTLQALVAGALAGCGGRDRVRVEAPPVPVTVRARAVAQALRSLIDNALDASPEGAPVEVVARVDAGEVTLVVRDRGVGMGDEVLARATEPFYTTKGPGKGMGLGLFVASAVAERLGGALALRSTAGEGSEATLRLPAGGGQRGGGDDASG
jgi:two-component system sensor histidine kinase RegB